MESPPPPCLCYLNYALYLLLPDRSQSMLVDDEGAHLPQSGKDHFFIHQSPLFGDAILGLFLVLFFFLFHPPQLPQLL